ncbi:hypothetical protein AMAG_03887 [Allomyces macrogynus ATCC 38327]|uniref:Uncharacterized protein n=1 Tax=Allomyces macrogynus (strain ATCC 38327) TaxID=578462 RepID=A0A0L0SB21_ALLM3|nr:hypothetical protein AMAG_03887 [Allomyces macrogynus ATCC 38327]|eukprot:KNE59632.1 hypothetical protein AMAG_03887 [Allomyces macrogynus ATCC 38327]
MASPGPPVPSTSTPSPSVTSSSTRNTDGTTRPTSTSGTGTATTTTSSATTPSPTRTLVDVTNSNIRACHQYPLRRLGDLTLEWASFLYTGQGRPTTPFTAVQANLTAAVMASWQNKVVAGCLQFPQFDARLFFCTDGSVANQACPVSDKCPLAGQRLLGDPPSTANTTLPSTSINGTSTAIVAGAPRRVVDDLAQSATLVPPTERPSDTSSSSSTFTSLSSSTSTLPTPTTPVVVATDATVFGCWGLGQQWVCEQPTDAAGLSAASAGLTSTSATPTGLRLCPLTLTGLPTTTAEPSKWVPALVPTAAAGPSNTAGTKDEVASSGGSATASIIAGSLSSILVITAAAAFLIYRRRKKHPVHHHTKNSHHSMRAAPALMPFAPMAMSSRPLSPSTTSTTELTVSQHRLGESVIVAADIVPAPDSSRPESIPSFNVPDLVDVWTEYQTWVFHLVDAHLQRLSPTDQTHLTILQALTGQAFLLSPMLHPTAAAADGTAPALQSRPISRASLYLTGECPPPLVAHKAALLFQLADLLFAHFVRSRFLVESKVPAFNRFIFTHHPSYAQTAATSILPGELYSALHTLAEPGSATRAPFLAILRDDMTQTATDLIRLFAVHRIPGLGADRARRFVERTVDVVLAVKAMDPSLVFVFPPTNASVDAERMDWSVPVIRRPETGRCCQQQQWWREVTRRAPAARRTSAR